MIFISSNNFLFFPHSDEDRLKEKDEREGTGLWQHKGRSARYAIVPMRDLKRCVTIPLGWNTKGRYTLSVKLSDFTV